MADSPVNRMSFSWHDIFHLDEADKGIYRKKSRGDHNRLGIALQIGCVRFSGHLPHRYESYLDSTSVLQKKHNQSLDKYAFLRNSAFTHWVKEKVLKKIC
uniref:TnpA transposase n=1 Tax=Klebsiella pneumoniae TaxID=573 RepID=A0A8B0STI1_KLEPN|nr:TnpA transposase [Klebsiella pneumoniae]